MTSWGSVPPIDGWRTIDDRGCTHRSGDLVTVRYRDPYGPPDAACIFLARVLVGTNNIGTLALTPAGPRVLLDRAWDIDPLQSIWGCEG
jgi:hypothetical protein